MKGKEIMVSQEKRSTQGLFDFHIKHKDDSMSYKNSNILFHWRQCQKLLQCTHVCLRSEWMFCHHKDKCEQSMKCEFKFSYEKEGINFIWIASCLDGKCNENMSICWWYHHFFVQMLFFMIKIVCEIYSWRVWENK